MVLNPSHTGPVLAQGDGSFRLPKASRQLLISIIVRSLGQFSHNLRLRTADFQLKLTRPHCDLTELSISGRMVKD